jgi:hypothetical protein
MVSAANCRCRFVNIVPLAGFSDALSAIVWSEHVRQLGERYAYHCRHFWRVLESGLT